METKSHKHMIRLLATTFFIGCMILGIGVFQSCEKDEMDYQLDIPDVYNDVGKLHNEGLNHVWNAIKEQTIQNMEETNANPKSFKKPDYYAIVEESTLDFCKNHKKLRDQFEICQKALAENKPLFKSGGPDRPIPENILPGQKMYLRQIKGVLSQRYSKKELPKLKARLDEINRSAAREMKEDESAVIYCATSTAYSSYQYWMRNYKKWYLALNFPEILEKYKAEQLNQLQVKNGRLLLKGTDGWVGDAWDSVEDWYYDTTDYLEEWWEEDGAEIANDDVAGAITGALTGWYTASQVTTYSLGTAAPSAPAIIIGTTAFGTIIASGSSAIDQFNE